MNRMFSTALATLLVVGSTTGGALAVSGGPGGKGDGSSGSLGVTQQADSRERMMATGEVSLGGDATRSYDGGAEPSMSSSDAYMQRQGVRAQMEGAPTR